jgi:heat shock protein HtpX
MTTYEYQARNVRKTIFLIFIMTTILMVMGLGMSYFYRSYWFLIGAIVVAVFQGSLGFFAGEKMALSSAGGEQISLEQAPRLYNLVEDIARVAGVKMPDVYISPDPSPNAFACGIGPNRASICFNQGLLEMLNKQELEGVIAHEMSHIKNKDILVMTIAYVLSAAISVLADIGIRMPMPQRKDDESSPFDVIFIVLIMTSYFIAPIIATILVLGVSRSREYLADAGAVQLTRYPQGLISALEKLHADPTPSEHFSSSTNHFYIAPPKKDYNQKFQDGWFSTHPSLENRIKNLMDQDGTLR